MKCQVCSEDVCPNCGVDLMPCEYPDCDQFAYVETWLKRGIMMVRMRVCRYHVKASYAYINGRPEALQMVQEAIDKGMVPKHSDI